MKQNYEIDPNKMVKIRRKLLDIAITKIGLNMKPQVGIPEFKHIICSYKLPKKSWWQVAKLLEGSSFIKIQRNRGISVNINQSIQLSSEMRMALLYLNNQNLLGSPGALSSSDIQVGILNKNLLKKELV